MAAKPKISIVIPLLNERESLGELSGWIERVMCENSLSYEIIFVDDGSTDGSWAEIKGLAAKNTNVKGIKLRGNHGKSLALKAGFMEVSGDVIFTMDADLQDSPDELPEMYRMIKEEGYDLVSGWKKKRYDPKSKTIPTKLFNWTARRVSGLKLHDFNCGLKAYKREVAGSLDIYGEMHRYMPMLAQAAGFSKIGEKVVQHRPRKFGHTKFGLDRFVNGMLDLITIVVMRRFDRRPMHIFGLFGLVMFLVSFIGVLVIGIGKIIQLSGGVYGRLVTDNAWFYISLAGLQLGVMFFLAGFICELVIKNRRQVPDIYLDKRT